ncbi:LysE family translocator [Maribacter aestuarii]|uniref:LysE family translocator n=1 Tax=Maribacter aestuarii TaxID=1130723 RepID=UPI00248B0362|nr:LysE family translocator [Maribacter aestuarii]
MDYSILLAFSLATFALALSPGPDNIFVMIQSISNGRKYGLATVAGLMTGCLVHTTLLAFGISAVIKNNPFILVSIKVFGAVYLLYLSWVVFKADSNIALNDQVDKNKGLLDLFRKGFIMNVLNPKVTIFFLAFFPGFLFSDEISNVVQFYILGMLFILVSSLVFGSIALLAGTINSYLNKNKSTGFLLKWLQIIVFIAIAIYLLFG